ncbi:MAG: hypothetical protein QNJ29_12580 [Rhizobiaceae bacterium]|nr:hypothetical protein [Rhizobiaceae bacterium]
MEPKLTVEKRFLREFDSAPRSRFSVRIKAEISPQLDSILRENCGDEIIMQKPVLYGSLPFSVSRDSNGIPTNTHLLNFLKSGDTVVVSVEKLLNGYTFFSDNVWDAIAFEDYARSSFERFRLLCSHAMSFA